VNDQLFAEFQVSDAPNRVGRDLDRVGGEVSPPIVFSDNDVRATPQISAKRLLFDQLPKDLPTRLNAIKNVAQVIIKARWVEPLITSDRPSTQTWAISPALPLQTSPLRDLLRAEGLAGGRKMA
jgi:hypothetical protein